MCPFASKAFVCRCGDTFESWLFNNLTHDLCFNFNFSGYKKMLKPNIEWWFRTLHWFPQRNFKIERYVRKRESVSESLLTTCLSQARQKHTVGLTYGEEAVVRTLSWFCENDSEERMDPRCILGIQWVRTSEGSIRQSYAGPFAETFLPPLKVNVLLSLVMKMWVDEWKETEAFSSRHHQSFEVRRWAENFTVTFNFLSLSRERPLPGVGTLKSCFICMIFMALTEKKKKEEKFDS